MIKKVESKNITYFDLFPLLDGLEYERPGIKDRIWRHMNSDNDYAFKPWNGRISTFNLYFYGLGDEYPNKEVSEYIEISKDNHPKAFEKGTDEYELRLDLNFIWSTYENEIKDPEAFAVKVNY